MKYYSVSDLHSVCASVEKDSFASVFKIFYEKQGFCKNEIGSDFVGDRLLEKF